MKCGNCRLPHGTVADVRACYASGRILHVPWRPSIQEVETVPMGVEPPWVPWTLSEHEESDFAALLGIQEGLDYDPADHYYETEMCIYCHSQPAAEGRDGCEICDRSG
jgi:hypothetical protein